MKKQLVIIGIVTLLVIVGLSGCQESQTVYKPPISGDTDKVELLNYAIETYGTTSVSSQEKKLGDGFIHNSIYNISYYIIKGTIKNIDHHVLFNISITVNFYDENKTYLASKSDIISIIRRNFTHDFGVYYTKEQPYFDNITQIDFEIKAS